MTDDTEADTVMETEIEEIGETLTREAFVARLRALADALDKGEDVQFAIADETIALPKDALYTIGYEGDEDEQGVALQVSWSRAEEENGDED